jgi:Ras-related protein Rab-8A
MSKGRKNAKHDYLLKLLLIGDSSVGKSCLLLRYSDGNFTSSYITTIGIDFKIKNITQAGHKLKLQIWDTAGQERFRTITSAYYRGAMGIFLVYDVTDETSFTSVQNWMKQIDENAEKQVVRVLIGNKCDMPTRTVDYARGKKFADDNGMAFFETSAKEDICVNEAFAHMAESIVNKLKSDPDAFAGSNPKTQSAKKLRGASSDGAGGSGSAGGKACC